MGAYAPAISIGFIAFVPNPLEFIADQGGL
jgi:hypothetical protein